MPEWELPELDCQAIANTGQRQALVHPDGQPIWLLGAEPAVEFCHLQA
jgi:hypothetical protein